MNFNKKEFWKIIKSGDFILLIIVAFLLFGVFFFFDVGEIKDVIENAGPIAPLLFILTKISTIVFAPVSGAPLYLVAGALFGFWEGLVLIIVGDILGGVVAFYVSRILGRNIVNKLIQQSDIHVLEKAVEMIGSVKGFIVTRAIFVSLPEVPCYAAGLTNIKFGPFLLIHSLISIPPAMVLVGFGSAFSLTNTVWGLVFLSVFGLIVAAISGWFFYLVAKNHTKECEPKQD